MISSERLDVCAAGRASSLGNPALPEQMVTACLIVCPYRAGDGRWYAEMSARHRPHLARYEAGNPVMTIRSAEDAEAVLRDFAGAAAEGRAYFLGCFLKDSGAFAGQICLGCLDWTVPEFTRGYFADVEHTGRGYMTEAARAVLRLCFAHLGARRVRLECDDSNGPSARLAERLGFTLEEHLHETHPWPDGSRSGTLRCTLAPRSPCGAAPFVTAAQLTRHRRRTAATSRGSVSTCRSVSRSATPRSSWTTKSWNHPS